MRAFIQPMTNRRDALQNMDSATQARLMKIGVLSNSTGRNFMNTVGNVAGPLPAYEVLTATMQGIMLFSRRRVSERMRTTAGLLLAHAGYVSGAVRGAVACLCVGGVLTDHQRS